MLDWRTRIHLPFMKIYLVLLAGAER
jgi:hypothetical protein